MSQCTSNTFMQNIKRQLVSATENVLCIRTVKNNTVVMTTYQCILQVLAFCFYMCERTSNWWNCRKFQVFFLFAKGIELETGFFLSREITNGWMVLVSEINACLHVIGHWKTAKPSKEKVKFYDTKRYFKEIK